MILYEKTLIHFFFMSLQNSLQNEFRNICRSRNGFIAFSFASVFFAVISLGLFGFCMMFGQHFARSVISSVSIGLASFILISLFTFAHLDGIDPSGNTPEPYFEEINIAAVPGGGDVPETDLETEVDEPEESDEDSEYIPEDDDNNEDSEYIPSNF